MNNLSIIENVMIKGDLSVLTQPQKIEYYSKVCESVGLNPLTKPLEFIKLNGKEVLYATKGAAEQLRRIHGVSVKITATTKIDDIYIVVVEASDRSGRTDGASGAVSINGLKGDALANAFLKAETKAKRRVTLSICGLNMLDETEVETIFKAEKINPFAAVNHQPQADDGGGPKDEVWRFTFGSWNKKSLEEIYKDKMIGPEKMINYIETLDNHIAAGKYADKHELFKEAQTMIISFLIDCDNEEMASKARSFKMIRMEIEDMK